MIGDDLAAHLPELQAQAESMMRSTCLVRRPNGVTTDGRGADVVTYETAVVYTGRCQVKQDQAQVTVVDSADSSVTIQRYEVKVPVSAGPFRVGDVIQVDGRRFRVAGLHQQTFQTAQRLPVEEMP